MDGQVDCCIVEVVEQWTDLLEVVTEVVVLASVTIVDI